MTQALIYPSSQNMWLWWMWEHVNVVFFLDTNYIFLTYVQLQDFNNEVCLKQSFQKMTEN